MPLSTLQVVLTGTPDDAVTLRSAFAIARPCAGHVDACLVLPHPARVIHAADLYESTEDRQTLFEQLRRQARETFDTETQRADVSTRDTPDLSGALMASYREASGEIAPCLREMSPFADLVVFPPLVGPGPGGVEDAFLESLIAGHAAVLLVPRKAPQAIGRRIAIGWDGGLAAAHALAAAIPLLETCERAVLLSVADGPPPDATEALAYLALHGVAARTCTVAQDGLPVARRLAEAALHEGCDLLVAGGYGHSRTLESVFGGTTERLTSHSDLPLFLLH